MEYTDQETGEVTIAPWHTLTEIGRQLSVGPRQIRTILLAMGFLVRGGRLNRSTIARHHIRAGHGKTFLNSQGQPFDVISPSGLAYIKQHWHDAKAIISAPSSDLTEAKVRYRQHIEDVKEIGIEEAIRLIRSWYPDMSRNDIAETLGFSRRTVYKYLK